VPKRRLAVPTAREPAGMYNGGKTGAASAQYNGFTVPPLSDPSHGHSALTKLSLKVRKSSSVNQGT
jgi:hypothetical protein